MGRGGGVDKDGGYYILETGVVPQGGNGPPFRPASFPPGGKCPLRNGQTLPYYPQDKKDGRNGKGAFRPLFICPLPWNRVVRGSGGGGETPGAQGRPSIPGMGEAGVPSLRRRMMRIFVDWAISPMYGCWRREQ